MASDELNRNGRNQRNEALEQNEQTPLLHNGQDHESEGGDDRELLEFDDNDEHDPKQWPKRKKLINVAVIALMSSA